MRRLLLMAITIVLAFAAMGGWRAGSYQLENMQLSDDMRDLASQVGVNATYRSPHSDDDFRAAVIARARDRGVDLDPDQVTVQRTGSGMSSTMYLAADYTETVNLPWHSYVLHFTPSSVK